jgi:hypothetical protein
MPKMSLFGKITQVYIQIDSTVKQMEHFILSTTHVVSDGWYKANTQFLSSTIKHDKMLYKKAYFL